MFLPDLSLLKIFHSEWVFFSFYQNRQKEAACSIPTDSRKRLMIRNAGLARQMTQTCPDFHATPPSFRGNWPRFRTLTGLTALIPQG